MYPLVLSIRGHTRASESRTSLFLGVLQFKVFLAPICNWQKNSSSSVDNIMLVVKFNWSRLRVLCYKENMTFFNMAFFFSSPLRHSPPDFASVHGTVYLGLVSGANKETNFDPTCMLHAFSDLPQAHSTSASTALWESSNGRKKYLSCVYVNINLGRSCLSSIALCIFLKALGSITSKTWCGDVVWKCSTSPLYRLPLDNGTLGTLSRATANRKKVFN